MPVITVAHRNHRRKSRVVNRPWTPDKKSTWGACVLGRQACMIIIRSSVRRRGRNLRVASPSPQRNKVVDRETYNHGFHPYVHP